MATIDVSVVIRRPPAEVFAYYVDPTNRPEWSDHVLEGAWLTPLPVGVGSIFVITLRQWGRVMRTERRITEFVRGQKLCYVIDSGIIYVNSCQTFAPHPDGTTFRIEATIHGKGWVRLIFPLIAGSQRTHLKEEADNLKHALESGKS